MTPSKPARHGGPDIILYGGPGSGKSTQASSLAKKMNARHLNVGALLRKVSTSQSAEGRAVRRIIERGKLAPVTITNNLVKKFVSKTPRNQRVIFDGYPRDNIQMKFLDKLLDSTNRSAVMVYVKLPISVARERLLKRAKIEHRTDDLDPKALTSRIQVFHSQAKNLLVHYKNSDRLIVVNGDQTVKQVEIAINKALLRC